MSYNEAGSETLANQKIEVQSGTIAKFDAATGRGTIDVAGANSRVGFKSVDFSSGRPARFPQLGEEVEVVMAQGVMVSVRSVD